MGLLDALRQYIADALPGGLLNPETKPVANQAKYIGGLLDPKSPISQDAQNWHKRTQIGLADQLAGRQTPEAEQAYQTMMQAAGIAPVGMIAWHGSPHKFDKFDLSKIGTGEGAQAYGHGLYLAESPEVAQTYKTAGTFNHPQIAIDGKPYVASSVLNNVTPHNLAADAYSRFGNKKDAIAWLDDFGQQAEAKKILKKAKSLEDVTDKQGALYKTDIPDEAVARFLDWDKPLSQQAPEVQAAFESRVSPIRAEMAKPADPGWGDLAAPSNFDPTGQELLGLLRNRDASLTAQQFLGNGLGPDISTALKQQGIPGIRYLDGGSRSAGQGSSNFVVFDDQLPRILERNGVPTGQQPWKPGEWQGLLGL